MLLSAVISDSGPCFGDYAPQATTLSRHNGMTESGSPSHIAHQRSDLEDNACFGEFAPQARMASRSHEPARSAALQLRTRCPRGLFRLEGWDFFLADDENFSWHASLGTTLQTETQPGEKQLRSRLSTLKRPQADRHSGREGGRTRAKEEARGGAREGAAADFPGPSGCNE